MMLGLSFASLPLPDHKRFLRVLQGSYILKKAAVILGTKPLSPLAR